MNRFNKWFTNKNIDYTLSFISFPPEEDTKSSAQITAVLGNINSFYNLTSLLNILSAKGYPFVQKSSLHIATAYSQEEIHADYIHEINWSNLYLSHDMQVKGTEAEIYALLIARIFRMGNELFLNYDEAKGYLVKLNANKRKGILGFMRKTAKN